MKDKGSSYSNILNNDLFLEKSKFDINFMQRRVTLCW